MSDTMFYGVLRMPFSMAMSDEMSRFQFHSRAQEAADRVERAEKELATLRTFVREVANQRPEDCAGQRQSNKERAEDLCETWGIV